MNPEIARRQMVAQQVRVWDVFDQDVLEVLGKVARERFVPAGFEEVAYADTEIPIRHGQVMLRPVIEGRLLQALDVDPGDQVLEVGTGTGYLTACLAGLGALVTSVDIHDEFIELADRNLEQAKVQNVTLHCMDAMQQLPEGKFDAIAVTGSVPRVEQHFVDILKSGGRLFLVVGKPPVMSALLIARAGNELSTTALFETSIPPLENVAKESAFFF